MFVQLPYIILKLPKKVLRFDKKKMTTPSRKLRHTAEASLTVFLSERGGGGGGGVCGGV